MSPLDLLRGDRDGVRVRPCVVSTRTLREALAVAKATEWPAHDVEIELRLRDALDAHRRATARPWSPRWLVLALFAGAAGRDAWRWWCGA